MTIFDVNMESKRQTIAGAAAAELRRRILEGELAEGASLRQDALAAEFGISRIPIREALLELEAEGLVKIVPHRGAVVSDLSVQEIEELVQLRAMLEPHLLRSSAPRLTRADFAELDKLLRTYDTELKEMKIGEWGKLNRTLHLLLYARADQPRTQAIVGSLLQHNDRYTRMQLSLTHETEKAQFEHEQLVELCRKREIDAACELLKSHIRQAGDDLVRFIENRPPAKAVAS